MTAGERLKAMDPWAGPIASFAAAAGRAMTTPFRSPTDRPLVIRPGGLGDLVCAQIALEELRLDPRDVLWLVETRSASWADYAHLPHLAYDSEWVDVVRTVAGRHRLVINTEQRFGLSQAVATLACSRDGRSVAFATNRQAGHATVRVPYDWDATHETVEFRHLFATAFGLADRPSDVPMRRRLRPSDGTVVVAISGTNHPSRTFGADEWAAFVRSHATHDPLEIVAAPSDSGLASALASRVADARVVAGTFADMCERLATAEAVLTVDGGPVHIASYFGVPTTAVFTSGRDRKWAPLAEGSRVLLRPELACRPCTVFGQPPPCPHNYACKDITALRLFEAGAQSER